MAIVMLVAVFLFVLFLIVVAFPTITLRIMNKLFGWELVLLTDFDGDNKLSHGYYIGNIHLAKRWWPGDIRTCELKDDGTVAGDSYVRTWRKV